MYCYKCGRQLADNASFCSNCGSAMNQAQQQPAPAAPQPPQAAPAQPQQQPQWQQPVPPQPNNYAQPQQPYPPAQAPVYQQPPAAPVPPPTQAPIPAEKRIYTAPPQAPMQAAPQAPAQAPQQAPVQAPPMPVQQAAPTPSAPVAAPAAPVAAAEAPTAIPTPAPQPAQPIPAAPPPPPAGAPIADTAGLNNALHAGISVVPKRSKTKIDMLCGVVFLLLGIAALGIYGFASATLMIGGGLVGMFPVLQSFTEVRFLTSLLSLGYIFALAAGILMALGGVFALTSGRGRKPAYTAIVLMLFTLAFDVVYLLLMSQWGHLSMSIGEAIARSFVIYAFEVVFVLVPTILLMLKKRAKKRARTTLVLQTNDGGRKGGSQPAAPAQAEPVIPVPQEDPAGTAEKPEASKPAEPVGMDVPLTPPAPTMPEETAAISEYNSPE